jgi:hypothetical protein
VPAPGDEARSIEIIALEEIEHAVVVVIKRNLGMDRDDLVRETARLLVHVRIDTVRPTIESGINRLIRRGIVHQNGERLNIE